MSRRHDPPPHPADPRRRAREDASGRCYWALLATPDVFDIEAEIAERPTGLWTTDGQPLAPGDPVLVWKALGRGGPRLRGVVALGEVTGWPEVRAEPSPYWVDPARGAEPKARAAIRYEVPPGLPLWLGGGAEVDAVLGALSVSRGQGRAVFHVTPGQWRAVADLAGWQELAETGQRWVAEDGPPGYDARVALAVAMASVRGFYASLGYAVDEDAAGVLLVRGPAGEERRVFVHVAGSDGAIPAFAPFDPATVDPGPAALFVVAGDGSGRLLRATDPWDGRPTEPAGRTRLGPDAP